MQTTKKNNKNDESDSEEDFSDSDDDFDESDDDEETSSDGGGDGDGDGDDSSDGTLFSEDKKKAKRRAKRVAKRSAACEKTRAAMQAMLERLASDLKPEAGASSLHKATAFDAMAMMQEARMYLMQKKSVNGSLAERLEGKTSSPNAWYLDLSLYGKENATYFAQESSIHCVWGAIRLRFCFSFSPH